MPTKTKAAKTPTLSKAQQQREDVADIIKFLPQRYEARFPLAELEEFPGTPKEHDVGAIDESVDANGWYGAIVAQTSTKRVLAGHGRRDALLGKGVTHAPVLFVDCDDKTARRIVLVDNRTTVLGGFSLPRLAEFATSVAEDGDLRGTGYDGDDVDAMNAKLAAPAGFPSFDENIATEHQCPKCGYEWSGGARPKTSAVGSMSSAPEGDDA